MASGYDSEQLFNFNHSGPEHGEDYFPQNQQEPSDPNVLSQGTKEGGNEQSSESSEEIAPQNDDVSRWCYNEDLVPAKRPKVGRFEDDSYKGDRKKTDDGMNGKGGGRHKGEQSTQS